MHVIIRKTQLLRIITAKKLKQNTGPLQSKKYNCTDARKQNKFSSKFGALFIF